MYRITPQKNEGLDHTTTESWNMGNFQVSKLRTSTLSSKLQFVVSLFTTFHHSNTSLFMCSYHNYEVLKPAYLLTKLCSFSFPQRKMSFTSPLISPFFFLFSCAITYVSVTCFRFLSSEPHSRQGCLGTLTSTDVTNIRLRDGFWDSHRIHVKLSVSWQTGSETFTDSLFVACLQRATAHAPIFSQLFEIK